MWPLRSRDHGYVCGLLWTIVIALDALHSQYLGATRSIPIQQMVQIADLQSLECSCIQGKKLKSLTSHSLHQKLQHGTKTRLKSKSFKHKLKNYKKKMLIFWRQIQEMWGTPNECLGTAEEPSRSQNWNSRPCSKGNTGSRTAESAHTGDGAGSLSQEHLDPCLHRWLCREGY